MSIEDTKDGSGTETSMGGSPLKKPYSPPTLVDWGTLRQVTQTVGNKGNTDGGGGMKARTQA